MSPTLYIRISDTDLCFARYEAGREPVFDFSRYRARHHASLTMNLREAKNQESILQAPIERVEALVVDAVTVVPLADFQEEDAERFYRHCFAEKQHHRVFYDTVPSANAVVIFSVEESVCHTLEDQFGKVRYTSSLTPVVEHFASLPQCGAPAKRIYIYCHDQAVDVIAFDESRLCFLNTFKVLGEKDVAYYVLNAASSLVTEEKEAAFYVAGEATEAEAAIKELSRYVANVYAVHPEAEFNRNIVATTPDVPYDLITLLL